MRNTNRAGRKSGSRRKNGDEGPDLFSTQLSQAVKVAFAGAGGVGDLAKSDEASARGEGGVAVPLEESGVTDPTGGGSEEFPGDALLEISDAAIPEPSPEQRLPTESGEEIDGALETGVVSPAPGNPEASVAALEANILQSKVSPLPIARGQFDPLRVAESEGVGPATLEIPLPSLISAPPFPVLPAVEPLPARMLNEFVYCPRLFYYEHVEGVFVDNADTLRGSAIHARVDKGSGAMLPAEAAASKGKKRGKRADGTGAENADAAANSAPGNSSADSPNADAGEGAGKPDTIHSRSATLGSDRLGVIAKLDLVEMRVTASGIDGAEAAPGADPNAPAGEGEGSDELPVFEVCPVDYKAGAPRAGEDGNDVWPPDRMQLGLQMLLLRESGYRCEQGIIYYRATKQRVPLLWSAELEAWVLAQIDAARRTMTGPIPPPLAGSPKCVRCSLNVVCLPDETRLLAEASPQLDDDSPAQSPESGAAVSRSSPAAAPPRRLMAARDDKRVLFLNKPGLRVGRKDELLTVKEDGAATQEVRISDVSHVALFGNIQISTQAIQILCEKEVPISYFSMGGWFYGITRGLELKNVFTRMEQFRLARDPLFCLALARKLVHGKIRNHRTQLRRGHLNLPTTILAKLKTMAESALQAKSLEELLGIEGAAASFYFSAFSGMLKIDDEFADESSARSPQLRFNFEGRNRRPPTDPVNALLSLAYSLLAKDCAISAATVGLDPYVGFYHQPRYGRPALALDLMEEFRPLIAESAVLTCINNRMILPRHFVQAGKAVNLTPEGRKIFFTVYERRMNDVVTHPIFEYEASYRRVLELQFRLLARYLTGEIPEYPPFVTR